MDTSRIIKEQRDMIFNKYGFNIKVEESQLSDYKYTITTCNNGGFTTTIYRNIKDEVDTLLQLIFYMDSVPYKISFAEAQAYDDCLSHCYKPCSDSGYWITTYIREKRNNSIKVDVEKELPEIGINSISSLHCNNILGLELSRKILPQLYTELKWLEEAADLKQVDYESIIPIDEESAEF